MDTQLLRLTQMDRVVKEVSVPARPLHGWIQTIRTALGMTTRQLAARLNINQSTLTLLEKSEANNNITLHSLHKVADALDCDLQYVLVPRSSLRKRVDERAEFVARNRVTRIWHSMRLEDQAPTTEVDEKEISKIKKNLLDSKWKQLWD
jgi:predicted DNA-binding mobile mystery protein A